MNAALPRAGVAAAHATRLVIDTNVVLDMLVFDDPDGACVRSALERGEGVWLTTAAMRAELARVLDYPQIAARLGHAGRCAAAVLHAFDTLALATEPAPRAAARCLDPDDQLFIDLACAHAACLLSKDRAVLKLRKRLPALACTPRELLAGGWLARPHAG